MKTPRNTTLNIAWLRDVASGDLSRWNNAELVQLLLDAGYSEYLDSDYPGHDGEGAESAVLAARLRAEGMRRFARKAKIKGSVPKQHADGLCSCTTGWECPT